MNNPCTPGTPEYDEYERQEAAEGTAPDILAAPSNPMAVARHIMSDVGRPDTLRHWRGGWIRWEGTHWAEVDDREIRSKSYQRVEKAVYITDDGESKPWAPTKRKIADLLEAMQSIVHLSSTVDPPTWLVRTGPRSQTIHIACSNGLLEVATRELSEHTSEYFNLASVPFAYELDAPEPKRWLEFLDSLWPDDPDSVAALQEYFGYVISGRTDLHKILLIVGPTRAGKGTIVRVLEFLVGRANIAGPTLSSLSTNFGLAPLLGKPLAVISDARLGAGSTHQVVERLLSVSGEDTLTVDRKYREPWTGRIGARFVILSNELPSFGDSSGAIAHRFIALVLTRSWLGKEDTSLGAALATEAPGILNWALDGLTRLTEAGRFTEPASAIEAITTMKDNASPTSAFVREVCEVGPAYDVAVDPLYVSWKSWCEDNGRDRPGTKQAFGRNLRSVVPGLKIARPRDGDDRQRRYVGLKLQPQWQNSRTIADHGDQQPEDDLPVRDGPHENPLWGLRECCEGGPTQPKCGLCPKSESYWRKER